MTEPLRSAWAEVDLDVIRSNAEVLRGVVAPAELCAIVKADGYGHGAVEVARSALAGGATRLGVALVEEGRMLRDAGIGAPILVLSEPQVSAMAEVVASQLTPTIYTIAGVEALSDAVAERGGEAVPVHVKVDTGMHRVGASAAEALDLLRVIADCAHLELEGIYTHFAVADEPSNTFTDEQARRFSEFLDEAKREGFEPPLVHCANSAAALLRPDLRMSFVRCGIALYGVAPSSAVVLPDGVAPAMTVRARLSYVKEVASGEAISYGQQYRLQRPSTIATVPVGYADGLPCQLTAAGEVLVGGRRRRIAGRITMDQTTVDCGEDDTVSVGDEVVLLGRQGGIEISASEWAARIGTIAYEIVTRIGPRLPRRYVGHVGPVIEVPFAESRATPGTTISPDDRAFDAQPRGEWLHQMRPG